MADTSAPIALGLGGLASLFIISGLQGKSLGQVLQGDFGPSLNPKGETASGATGSVGGEPGSGGAKQGQSLNAQGIANPLPGFKRGRVDQGVDFSGSPGAPIYAMGRGRVLGIIPNWYAGQPFLYYEITQGPLRGKVIYVAEQIAPSVSVGQEILAGQVIGHYASSGTGIETGYATRSGQTLAKATTGYSEGQETTAGKEFLRLLEKL